MVALLLNAGADATIRDGEGNAAIHIAAQFSYWPIVAYLGSLINFNVINFNQVT